MARYTQLFTIATPLDRFRHLLEDVLQSCNCAVIYDGDDYMVARERPGGVTYAQLVTVEVLIDKTATAAPKDEVRLNVVVKNEELPLKSDNHCWRMFSLVNRAVAENSQWNLLSSTAG